MRLRSSLRLALAITAGSLAACSIANAPDDVIPGGAGGAGGASTTSTTSTTKGKPCNAAANCDPNYRCSGAICVDGHCEDGAPPTVDDGDACTHDACDTKAGVTHIVIPLDDANACTVDACDHKTGITHTPVKVDDGDVCTVDTCDPAKGPQHAPRPDLDDNNFCTDDTCDAKTGAVDHVRKPNCFCQHSVCDDGNGVGEAPLDALRCTFGPDSDCVASVCLKQAKCCSQKWTAECKALAMDSSVCNAAKAGMQPSAFSCTCSHDVRCTGIALYEKCDPCVKLVCAAKPDCCMQSWNQACVEAATTMCNAPPVGSCP